jgi:phosphoribosylformylglycinamidine cyclo-ligase
MEESYRYERRGVSATKDEVHAAIKGLDKGLFPLAFCKIIPDIVGGDPAYCNIMHADTAGAKTSLAYLYWKETGDLSVWAGIAQDAIVMNLDDMACVGCVDDIVLSSTIGRNKRLISGEVLAAIIQGARNFLERLADHGVRVSMAGGETADVGDIVRTIDVGYTAFARLRREAVLVNDIRAGDAVLGLASFGQATYEDRYNSGMGSNGLTSARHDVLSREYGDRYPESFDPHMPQELVYSGALRLGDLVDIGEGRSLNVGQLLLSPTRTYLPLVKVLLERLRPLLHGMIHCTGGGQTKVLKFLRDMRVIKDNLFPSPPLFRLIQEQSGAAWREMYQVFNMGHRLELYLPPAAVDEAIGLAAGFGIEARLVGRVEEAPGAGVRLETPNGVFEYS